MHKGQTLMCKRAIEPRRGYWTIPAGFLELNETTSQGAEREAFEEALAKIKTKKLISIFNIPRVGQVQIIYLADMVDGQFGIGEESEEVELCSFEQALAKEIAFPNVREALLHAQKIVEGSETGILEKAYV